MNLLLFFVRELHPAARSYILAHIYGMCLWDFFFFRGAIHGVYRNLLDLNFFFGKIGSLFYEEKLPI